MEDFEKLGAFYLGREYDLATKELGGLLLYDSKDLVTHGVCVGMTGSGKTGLCIGLLEEAAIDSIPSLVIDPKGDLTNLLLTFPDLRPDDFRPWISEEDAGKKGLSPDDFAREQAEMWKKGLADWGQDPSRIARLRAAADFTIYTPGSTAGLPVSILKSFSAPAQAVRDDPESLRDRINTVATSLLGLLGMTADPIQSREHILLSSLLDAAWSAGQDLDLACTHPADPDASLRQGGRPRPGGLLSRRRTASDWPCCSTTCWPPRRSRPGWRAKPSTSAGCCTRPRASPASRSSPSPISAMPSACSSSRCCSTRCWAGCAPSRERAACGPCSTWTRSSATSRRWPSRRRNGRC